MQFTKRKQLVWISATLLVLLATLVLVSLVSFSLGFDQGARHGAEFVYKHIIMP